MSDQPIAVVVGAGPGIGTAMAIRYAAAGFHTVGIARNDASLTALRAAARGGRALGAARADA